MQIEMRSVEALAPYAGNARTHPDSQIAQIAASIARFGWFTPLLISADDVIISGDGLLLAAKALGVDEVPVIVLDHLLLTDVQRRELVAFHNRYAEIGGWNEKLLRQELAALDEMDFDLRSAR